VTPSLGNSCGGTEQNRETDSVRERQTRSQRLLRGESTVLSEVSARAKILK